MILKSTITTWYAFIAIEIAGLLAITLPVRTLSLVSALVYVLLASICFGLRYAPRRQFSLTWALGALIFLSAIVIVGSAVFYLFTLSQFGITATIVSVPLIILGSGNLHLPNLTRPKNVRWYSPVVFILALCIALFLFYILTSSSAHGATVSPWQSVPHVVYFLYFIMMLVGLTALLSGSVPSLFTPLYLLAFSVAPLVFPLGFGFDPFIHHASEEIIAATGTLSPLPLYYVGYYVLIVIASSVFRLPVAILDVWMLPLLASSIIPVLMSGSFRYSVVQRTYASCAPLLPLLIPFSYLIQSTPQALSYLWLLALILIVFLRVHVPRMVSPWIMVLLGFAAFFMHPLTGIVALTLAFSMTVYERFRSPLQRSRLYLVSFFATAAGIPASLYTASLFSRELSIQFAPFSFAAGSITGPLFRYVVLDDLVYNFYGILPLVILLTAAFGMRELAGGFRHGLGLLVSTALGTLTAAWVIRSMFVFNFKPNEQSIFSDRILIICLLLLVPFLCQALLALIRRVRPQGLMSTAVMVVLFSAIATASWYLSYPRFDTHSQSKGYHATATDFSAVHLVQADSGTRPYVVLTNQTVSGVAVQEFGFAHYYQDQFYYPLPTSSRLYGLYEDLAKPDSNVLSILTSVRQLTGVSDIYFVLNNYWDSADRVRDHIAPYALRTYTSGRETTTIYKLRAP